MGNELLHSIGFASFVIDRQKGVRPEYSRRTRRLRFHVTLLTIDIACILASFIIASIVYPVNYNNIMLLNLIVIPAYLFSALAQRAYSVAVANNVKQGVARALHALVSSSVAMLFGAFLLKMSEDVSRVIFFVAFVCSFFTILFARIVFLRHSKRMIGGNPYNTAVITHHDKFAAFDGSVQLIDLSNFDVSLETPEMYHALSLALRDLDRVIVDCDPDKRIAWAHALQGANVSAEILMPELKEINPCGLNFFCNIPAIAVARGPLGLYERFTKRLFDLSIALAAMVVMSPLFVVVAIAIRLDSEGPIFFVQDRIGRGNRIFKVLKFRSMRVEKSDSAGHQSAARTDDRITKVGRFIRRSSIDELPQLINVLRGEMSVVGPRPHALGSRAEGKLFWEIDPRYWHRHATKPGLTGLAQVRGYRGATVVRKDLADRLNADLEYVRAWSLWLDVRIILQTFGVLVHRNAY